MRAALIILPSALVLSCIQGTRTNPDKSADSELNTSVEVAVNLDWLIGDWKRLNDEAGKETFENWEKVSPGAYSGIGFTLQEGDTVSQENMEIIETNGEWTLHVRMPDEEEATAFELSVLEQNAFTCTNDSIAFPTRIHYWLDGDKMKATISNDEMEIPFEFERIR